MQFSITNITLFLSLIASINALPAINAVEAAYTDDIPSSSSLSSTIETRQIRSRRIRFCTNNDFRGGQCQDFNTVVNRCTTFPPAFNFLNDQTSAVQVFGATCTFFRDFGCRGQALTGSLFPELAALGINDAISSWICPLALN